MRRLSGVVFCLFAFLICIQSCKEAEGVKEYNLEEGLAVKITNPAGEITDLVSANYLPPPFNLAQFQNKKTPFVVLSKRMNEGKTIHVKPIASVELIDSVSTNYVVAVPTHPEDQILEVNNFGMLATHSPEIKNMIEYWLSGNRKGLHSRVKWSSEQMSLDLME